MKINQFDQRILNYCRLNPDDPLSSYFIKNYEEAVSKRKAERRKWKMIADALEYIGKEGY